MGKTYMEMATELVTSVEDRIDFLISQRDEARAANAKLSNRLAELEVESARAGLQARGWNAVDAYSPIGKVGDDVDLDFLTSDQVREMIREESRLERSLLIDLFRELSGGRDQHIFGRLANRLEDQSRGESE